MKYEIQEISVNYVLNWNKEGDPFIIVDENGIDVFGEAFTEEEAKQRLESLNI